MKFTAGETIDISMDGTVLRVKIEDASKGDTISARIEAVPAGDGYYVRQICEFNRAEIASAG